MIRLTQARVVNWHYFRDTTLTIGERTLISGDNGMGKSTLVDAIQYALAADLRKARFNQAAGDRRGGRDLAGYVRCKIGSDSTEYLRGDTVAHIMLGFQTGEGQCTAGVCVEAFSDGRTAEHFWMGNKLDPHGVVVQEEGAKPLVWRQFRERIEARGAQAFESKREYLRNLTDRLGVFRRMSEYNPYLEAFTRSVSFTPLVSVDRFVCDYILEERPLSIQTMKDNLESYKEAERHANATIRKIAALRDIKALEEEYGNHRLILTRQDYLKLRLAVLLATEELEATEEKKRQAENRAQRLSHAVEQNGKERETLEISLREVNGALARDDNHALYSRMKDKIAALERELKTTGQDAERGVLLRTQCRALLALPPANESEEASLEAIDREMDALETERSRTEQEKHELGRTLDETVRVLREAAEELASLEKGIRHFPENSQQLARELTKKGIDAWILAELADITEPDWADAIEGWLNTLRFAVIVAPESFQQALEIYNALPRSIGGVALPNIAKMRGRSDEVKNGSLAQLVSSDNPWAQLYLDAILGEVMTADIATLKNYGKAITKECMSYSNHTATRIKEEVWKTHWLGRAAKEQRLAFLRQELARLGKEKETYAKNAREKAELAKAFGQGVRSLSEARSLALSIIRKKEIQAELDEARRELSLIDISTSRDLEMKREELVRRIAECAQNRDRLTAEEGKTISECAALAETTFRLRGQAEDCGNEFEAFCGRIAGLLADCEAYAAERLKNAEARTLALNYDASRKSTETKIQNILTQYRKKAAEFGNQFNAMVSVEIEDYPAFEETLARLERSELPAYQERIARARLDAEKEFREHFIAKLNEYILEARESFREINTTLRELCFGHDQYSFTLEERPDRRGQIRIVQKAAEITGYDGGLFEQIVDPEERKETERLFENIIKADLDSAEMRSICDYRTYFTYDIRMRDTKSIDPATGKAVELSLSRVIREKSGGESQTPYYVAIAASFYRFFKDKKDSTVRFVLFDEAFDKLDDERIGKVINFFANLDIQLMVAVPPGKIEAIAPLMDQIQIVSRISHEARVRQFTAVKGNEP